MSHDYSEEKLVQDSACDVLQNKLGWKVAYAYNTEQLGVDGTFGRTSYKEVLLTREIRKVLKRLNPWINEQQIIEAISKLTRRISTASLIQINEEKYNYLRDGIPVTVKRSDGRTEIKKAAIIDFNNAHNNEFLAVKELVVHGDLYNRRADIVGFVNGIPLLFIESKRPDIDVRNAYEDNYKDYLDTIPQLFYYNAFVMLSNGLEAKVGTVGSKYEFFHEWKRLDEDEKGSVAFETMLLGICQKENFLDLLENFILFDHSDGRTAKILARNHQYLGVNKAVEAYADRKLRAGKLGVFWHTQGSGKSYSMAFFAQKIRRKMAGSPTFVVLTDREELNTQISDTFENCGILGKDSKAKQCIATSGEDLITKLKGNPSFIFTLIHKFNKSDVEPIYPDHDIIIMSDEAHRSQYGLYADNMMKLLPTAARIGFTGTPLLSYDNITERTFGGYISVYDFKRAVEDGATVPLYYENRGAKLDDLQNPEITDEILDAIEAADLDSAQQEKLEKEFEKSIHILTAEPRLRSIAKDFVRHYYDVWTSGKAMFVCLNKVTCVRMYDYVQEYWKEEIKHLKKQIKVSTQQEAQELIRKLKWMEETDMAVVISQEQNEIQTFKAWGLDIETHRRKMVKRDLDKEFKDSDNPLRIVFVCAMWLTGFDVKCLSCLYLDKPLKAHTLMQTIARANRVNEGKSNGLIIDYIGIVDALKKALAEYTANVGNHDGVDPTIDKEKLVSRILELINMVISFFKQKDIYIEDFSDAKINAFDRLSNLNKAANAVCGTVADKQTFTACASELYKLMKYIERDDISVDSRRVYETIAAIHRMLKPKRRDVDTTDLMVTINAIISDHIGMKESLGQTEDAIGSEYITRIDISAINFNILRKEFTRVKYKNLLLRDLGEFIERSLDRLVAANPNRRDYFERYRQIIEEYNSGKDRTNIEKTFEALIQLVQELSEEESRYIREGFTTDDELAIFDLLKKDNPNKADIKKLKATATEMYSKITEAISRMDHWTDKDETTAEIQNLIRDILWRELPESYDEQQIEVCRGDVFEYVYTRFGYMA
jgi:type I site-specific deoxyribonuclease, hsdR family